MLVLFAAVAAARAQPLGDLTLADGRVFKAVVLVSEAPASITVRHDGGLAQIEKKALPESLRARFPADEAEAQRQRVEMEKRRAEALAQREIQAKQTHEKRAAEVADRHAAEAQEKKVTKASTEKTRAAVERGADEYFRTKWRPGNNEVRINDCSLRINSAVQKADYSGTWTFSGEAWVKYYVSSGRGVRDSKHVVFEGEISPDGVVTITEKL